jgi:glyoxylase-like metal-dependent hydrolase (beta-lactamase superfamily II)
MSSSAHGHPLPPRVEEVSDGVYAYIQPDGSWWINNTGFLAGRRGVIWVDLRCEVRHAGVAARTTNDSYVWIPERRLLFSGDLVFNGGRPLSCLA